MSLAGGIFMEDANSLALHCTSSLSIPWKQGTIGSVDCGFSGTFCLALLWDFYFFSACVTQHSWSHSLEE